MDTARDMPSDRGLLASERPLKRKAEQTLINSEDMNTFNQPPFLEADESVLNLGSPIASSGEFAFPAPAAVPVKKKLALGQASMVPLEIAGI